MIIIYNIFPDLIIRTPALPQFKGVNMLKLYKHWIKVQAEYVWDIFYWIVWAHNVKPLCKSNKSSGRCRT